MEKRRNNFFKNWLLFSAFIVCSALLSVEWEKPKNPTSLQEAKEMTKTGSKEKSAASKAMQEAKEKQENAKKDGNTEEAEKYEKIAKEAEFKMEQSSYKNLEGLLGEIRLGNSPDKVKEKSIIKSQKNIEKTINSLQNELTTGYQPSAVTEFNQPVRVFKISMEADFSEVTGKSLSLQQFVEKQINSIARITKADNEANELPIYADQKVALQLLSDYLKKQIKENPELETQNISAEIKPINDRINEIAEFEKNKPHTLSGNNFSAKFKLSEHIPSDQINIIYDVIMSNSDLLEDISTLREALIAMNAYKLMDKDQNLVQFLKSLIQKLESKKSGAAEIPKTTHEVAVLNANAITKKLSSGEVKASGIIEKTPEIYGESVTELAKKIKKTKGTATTAEIIENRENVIDALKKAKNQPEKALGDLEKASEFITQEKKNILKRENEKYSKLVEPIVNAAKAISAWVKDLFKKEAPELAQVQKEYDSARKDYLNRLGLEPQDNPSADQIKEKITIISANDTPEGRREKNLFDTESKNLAKQSTNLANAFNRVLKKAQGANNDFTWLVTGWESIFSAEEEQKPQNVVDLVSKVADLHDKRTAYLQAARDGVAFMREDIGRAAKGTVFNDLSGPLVDSLSSMVSNEMLSAISDYEQILSSFDENIKAQKESLEKLLDEELGTINEI